MSEEYSIDRPEDLDYTADVLKSIGQSQERLYTYLQLHDNQSPKHIAQDLDRTRNALQFYIDDWKEHDLVYTEGNDYLFTDNGELVAEALQDFNSLFEDGWKRWSRENDELEEPEV